MKKVVTAFLLLILLSPAAFPQQNQRELRGRNAVTRRPIEDVVLGFYISQFQQVADVSDEVLPRSCRFYANSYRTVLRLRTGGDAH